MKEEVLKQPQGIQAICSETGGRFKQGLKEGTTLELRCCLKLFENFPEGNEDRVSAITAELCQREKEKSPGTAIPKGTHKNLNIHYNTFSTENNPCYGCTGRNAECHAKCENYRAWKTAVDENKRIQNQKRREEVMVDAYKSKRVQSERAKRRIL